MDSEGWIPISLLASFKRVRHLTTDLDLVRDVLSMSSVVEVKGNWVRMAERHWEQFILPNAPMSVVEPIEASGIQPVLEEAGPMVSQDQEAVTEAEGEVEAEECEVDVEDEDEEDIVFVIGEEAEGSWMPERKQA
ncbi:hypothetical protein HYDPIDRAFT_91860 [Hydnomerulius pinastri MD-312]|uniref:HTH La-type RNA-binding domain-containing protein n=1 Tax=Hydnomerulius pinastri MD-312 TaxID=994086 RepID=A0A0C9VZA2_9AGAM|nr:hypothetical protein HYDPIDRAFT_91860 [Hydnomerulius pinastri MD-312]